MADPRPRAAGLIPKFAIPRSNNSASGTPIQINWPAQPCPYPINTWDSASLTRFWTHDLVRIAILRIMTEIHLDFYEDYYKFLEFDGSQQVVHKLWGEIKIIYTEFIKSYVFGIDVLTLIGMHEQALNGGPLADVNAVLADMICFFAAGKIGMEKRAEDMAEALISGGKINNHVVQ
jgi:hypothetical protein